MNDIDSTLATLADPTRRQVVDLLRDGPRRAGELAAASHVSPPAMSRHLRLLRNSGFVEDERDLRDTRVRLYRLRRDPFVGLQQWLEQVQSFWTEQLDAYKTHAESKERGEPR